MRVLGRVLRDRCPSFDHLLAIALIASLCAGCGGGDAADSVPLRGKVTYNSQPLTGGEVVYTPAEEGGQSESRMARGRIQPDGTFQLRTSPSIPGVVPGKYRISIVPAAEAGATAGPSADPIGRPSESRDVEKPFPDRYLRPDQSELEDTVDANHSGEKLIELKD